MPGTSAHTKPKFVPKTQAMVLIHKQEVYKDPEFIKRVKLLPKFKHKSIEVTKGWEAREVLARDFSITRSEVVEFETGSNSDRYYVDFELKHDVFTAIINKNITRLELNDLWESIQRLRKDKKLDNKHRRSLNYGDLYYAIYRGRCNKMSFEAIFDALESQTYPYYSRPLPRVFTHKDYLKKKFEQRYKRT